MSRIDVMDEAIIDADPSTVFKALIEELRGVTSWWKLHLESTPRDKEKFGRKGSVFDITVHRVGTPKFTARITEIIEGKLLNVEYIEGDFLGNGEWSFEPIDGKTKVRFRWNVVIKRPLYRVLGSYVVGKAHSGVMQQGLKEMNRYLTQK